MVRLTDRPDMTLDVSRDVKQQYNNNLLSGQAYGWGHSVSLTFFLVYGYAGSIMIRTLHWVNHFINR